MAIVFVSCNKNMKALDASYFKTTPNPLEEKAGKVDATVTGTFPVKYFNKKAVVTVTPVMKFNGEEVKGQSSVFQGEKILDNNQKIAYKAGGTYTMKPSFFYIPEMAKSELYLNFDVVQKKKNYTLPAVKIADGVLATSELVAVKDIKPALIADKFQRITQENQNADILFLIQQAQLRNSELKAEDVKAFTAKVKKPAMPSPFHSRKTAASTNSSTPPDCAKKARYSSPSKSSPSSKPCKPSKKPTSWYCCSMPPRA